jgi:hypothetical protein
VRHLSFKECSLQDSGLTSFCQGFLFQPSHLSSFSPTSALDHSPLLLALLQPYLSPGNTLLANCSPSSPILAVLDLSYNKLTDFSLLQPLFLTRDLGLSELMLTGNKISTENMHLLCSFLQHSDSLQKLHLANCGLTLPLTLFSSPYSSAGLNRESSGVLFHSLLKAWSRSQSCPAPLVNLSYPLLYSRDCLPSLQIYLEWNTEPSILRASCDDIVRGVLDTVTSIAPHTQTSPHQHDPTAPLPYSRLVPPLSVLNLEANLIGWMGAAVLSTCLTVPPLFLLASPLFFPSSSFPRHGNGILWKSSTSQGIALA